MHKLLRVMWYSLVLPPVRFVSRIAERFGANYAIAPPAHILAQYGMNDAAQYVRVGQKKRTMIQHHLSEQGLAISHNARILDFGCGAAGTLCAFHEHFPDASCFGCDLKDDVVDWVRRYRPELTVARTKPFPPLPDDFDSFDLVYGISVWTHMPERACSEWLRHMHRRIRRGGILFFTIAEPSTLLARNHGFDPNHLADKVRESGGCLYDSGTDMTYIQRDWLENEIKRLFRLLYFGPAKGHSQWAAVLERLPTTSSPRDVAAVP